MPTCGNCKTEGQSIEHIRSCHAQSRGSVATAIRKSITDIPASFYALPHPDGTKFFEVRVGKKGKWEGFRFVDHLIGAPGDWRRIPQRGSGRIAILEYIANDPKEFALRFSREFTICAACGAPLSDPESVARGFGPICAEKF